MVGVCRKAAASMSPAAVAPDYDHDRPESGREGVPKKIEEHFRKVSAELPFWKRVKRSTSGRATCPRPPSATSSAARWWPSCCACASKRPPLTSRPRGGRRGRGGQVAWLLDIVAHVSGRQRRSDVHAGSRLDELGFDSLMYTELGAALEGAGVSLPESVDFTDAWATCGACSGVVRASGPAAAATSERSGAPSGDRVGRRRGRSTCPAPYRPAGQTRAGRARSGFSISGVLDTRRDRRAATSPSTPTSSSPPTTARTWTWGRSRSRWATRGADLDVAGGGRLLLPQPIPARVLQELHQPGADGARGLDPQVDGHRRDRCCGGARAWSCSRKGRARSPARWPTSCPAWATWRCVRRWACCRRTWTGHIGRCPKGAAIPRTRQLGVSFGPFLSIEYWRRDRWPARNRRRGG